MAHSERIPGATQRIPNQFACHGRVRVALDGTKPIIAAHIPQNELSQKKRRPFIELEPSGFCPLLKK
jgi:hypothetical protein